MSLQPTEPSLHGLDDGLAYIGTDISIERRSRHF